MRTARSALVAFSVLLLVIAIFAVQAFAVSSEEALAKAKPYLDSTMAPLPKPLFVLSDYYFAYAPSIYSPQRVFIAVSQQTGEVETNEMRLSAIGTAVYDYGIVEEYVARNKISFGGMQTTVMQASTAIERNLDSLNALSSRTQQSYPSQNFDAVQGKALALRDAVSDLNSIVADGVGLDRQFENDFSDLSLSSLLEYYSTAFSKAGQAISDYDDYNNAISQKQTEIFKSSIPAPDNENIVKNLENMRLKIDLFENLRFLKPADNLQKLEGSREKWVNDSIASFSYKKLAIETQAKFNGVGGIVQSVYDGEAALDQCGLQTQVESFKTHWREIELLQERAKASDLERLPAKLDALKAEYDSLDAQYKQCIKGPQPVQQEQAPSSQSNYLPALALVVIIAGGYLVWRYKQSQEESYS